MNIGSKRPYNVFFAGGVLARPANSADAANNATVKYIALPFAINVYPRERIRF